MPRVPRKQSESNIYHVFARGVGHQLIFEDDSDRAFFLDTLGRLLDECGGELYAWALMGNHFHLLVHMPLETLSELMRNLQTAYALHYNKRYGHVGHLFQGRFGSQPIDSDEQLLACIRYIHLNPVKAGLSESCDYKWSSYRGYLRRSRVTKTEFVLALFGGIRQFIEFHGRDDEARFAFIDVDRSSLGSCSRRLTDSQGHELASTMFGDSWNRELPALPKHERNARLKRLKNAGLTATQIERLTGIGRNIINRA